VKTLNVPRARALPQFCGIKVSLIFVLYTRPIIKIAGFLIDVANQKVTM